MCTPPFHHYWSTIYRPSSQTGDRPHLTAELGQFVEITFSRWYKLYGNMATGTSSSETTLGIELEDRSRTAKKFWQERRAMFSMSVDEVEEDVDTDLQPRTDKPDAEEKRKPAMQPCKTTMMTMNSRRMSLDMGTTSITLSQDTNVRRAPRGSERRKLQRALSCVQPPKWSVPLGEPGEQEAAVDPGKTLEAGIVCSDEDLQSILGETSQGQASSRRQKLRGSRSLSLDSSFFKLKRAHTETHAWFSKILSMQRGEKDKEQGPGQEDSHNNVAGEPCSVDGDYACSSGHRGNSDNSCIDGGQSVLVQVEPQSPRRSYSSVSSSSDEEEEDKVSLLAVTAEEVLPPAPPARIQQQNEDTSKVVWNQSSVVDAGLLGHAIESYLTTSTTTPARKRSVPGGPRDNVAVSSALKGLFVKLIH